jgi:hypothetical protein
MLDMVGNAHDHCPSVLFVLCYRNDQGSVMFGALGRLWTVCCTPFVSIAAQSL